MGDFREGVEDPDVESVYECVHCGSASDDWQDDCPNCGGVLTRIVTEVRDDEPPTAP